MTLTHKVLQYIRPLLSEAPYRFDMCAKMVDELHSSLFYPSYRPGMHLFGITVCVDDHLPYGFIRSYQGDKTIKLVFVVDVHDPLVGKAFDWKKVKAVPLIYHNLCTERKFYPLVRIDHLYFIAYDLGMKYYGYLRPILTVNST